jgi:hypothetical protein
MILVGAKLSKDQLLPFRNLQTALFAYRINRFIKDHASILGGTDEMINQDRDVMALMQILAHMSDDTTLGASEASFGESDPQRLKKDTAFLSEPTVT